MAVDFLSAEDWSDLRTAGTLLAVYAGMTVLFGLVLRWRRKEPLFTAPDWRRVLLDHAFIAALLCLFVLQDLLDRIGLPGWLSFLVMMAVIIAVSALALRHIKRGMDREAGQRGIDNPASACSPAVPLSREEKRISLKMTGLALGGGALILAPLLMPLMFDFKAETVELVMLLVYCLAALGVLGWIMAGRWPFDLTLTSTIEIAATPQKVWETIRYVAGQPYYKGIVRRVEPVAGKADAFMLHYYADEDCVKCGLPRHPESSGPTALVEVLEAREPSTYRVRSWPKTNDAALKDSMDHEDESFVIERLANGHSRVTNSSTVTRPRVWLAALLKLGDPLGEHLRNLKAHIEGVEAGTIFEAGAARIAVARAAARHCGCDQQALAA
jgi:hypothetical protein